MTDLFRFMVLRAPGQVDPDNTIPIDQGGNSSLTHELQQASQSASPRAAILAIAQKFIASDKDFVRDPGSLNFGQQLSPIAEELQNPAGLKSASNSLPALVHSLFPRLAQTTTDQHFLDDKGRINDSIVALQIAPLPDNQLAGLLVNLSRAIDMLEHEAADEGSLKEPGALARAASRIVVLPPELFRCLRLPLSRTRWNRPPPQGTSRTGWQHCGLLFQLWTA